MSNLQKSARTLPLVLLSIALYIYQGYFLHRQQTYGLFASFAGLLILFYLLLKTEEKWAWRAGWLFRLSLLAATPWLSDDYARFVWDGRLLAHHLNPYLYLPSALTQTYFAQHIGLTTDLYQTLNSPGYFTVYPPFNQFLFGLAARLSGTNLWQNIVWLRIAILIGEATTAFVMPRLLQKMGKPSGLGLLYWLNPLVILELTGNLHFEGIMIALCLLALHLFYSRNIVFSALALALGISTKLLPLLFFPLILNKLGWKRGLFYLSLVGTLFLISFLPFLSERLISNFTSSLDLYFQKFEFNASIYYLVREMGYWLVGFNIVQTAGILLSISSFFLILWISWQEMWIKKPIMWITTPELWIIVVYFAMSTTIHPWYLTTLVAASVFNFWRFPFVWAGTAFLSYHTYHKAPYSENVWLTLMGYVVVVVFALFEKRLVTKKASL